MAPQVRIIEVPSDRPENQTKAHLTFSYIQLVNEKMRDLAAQKNITVRFNCINLSHVPWFDFLTDGIQEL